MGNITSKLKKYLKSLKEYILGKPEEIKIDLGYTDDSEPYIAYIKIRHKNKRYTALENKMKGRKLREYKDVLKEVKKERDESKRKKKAGKHVKIVLQGASTYDYTKAKEDFEYAFKNVFGEGDDLDVYDEGILRMFKELVSLA